MPRRGLWGARGPCAPHLSCLSSLAASEFPGTCRLLPSVPEDLWVPKPQEGPHCALTWSAGVQDSSWEPCTAGTSPRFHATPYRRAPISGSPAPALACPPTPPPSSSPAKPPAAPSGPVHAITGQSRPSARLTRPPGQCTKGHLRAEPWRQLGGGGSRYPTVLCPLSCLQHSGGLARQSCPRHGRRR